MDINDTKDITHNLEKQDISENMDKSLISAKFSEDVNALINHPNPDNSELDQEIIAIFDKYNLKNIKKNNKIMYKAYEKLMKWLYDNKNSNLRHKLAENLKTPPEILKNFSDNKDYKLLCKIAKHPNTDRETLSRLTLKKNGKIRFFAIKNPNTSLKDITCRIYDRSKIVRLAVASSSKLPIEYVIELLGNLYADVAENALKNPILTEDSLAKYATSSDVMFRRNIASCPITSIKTLKLLATDNDIFVRYNITLNPKTPEDILKFLSRDESSKVRSGVANNKKTPRDTLYMLKEDTEIIST
jgi:hypothetical protein